MSATTTQDDDAWGPPHALEHARIVEAVLFCSPQPVGEEEIAARLPQGADVAATLKQLQEQYRLRGIQPVRVAGGWTFRTAPDLAPWLRPDAPEARKLSRAAVETLAIIAYHQPVTRADIEAIRGVSVARGTLDVLIEAGWVRLRGRRRTPGRPVTFGTTAGFLEHFGLDRISDLPGMDDLKGAGLFDDGRLPALCDIPMPSDDDALRPDEDPIEPDALDFFTPAPNDEEDEQP